MASPYHPITMKQLRDGSPAFRRNPNGPNLPPKGGTTNGQISLVRLPLNAGLRMKHLLQISFLIGIDGEEFSDRGALRITGLHLMAAEDEQRHHDRS